MSIGGWSNQGPGGLFNERQQDATRARLDGDLRRPIHSRQKRHWPDIGAYSDAIDDQANATGGSAPGINCTFAPNGWVLPSSDCRIDFEAYVAQTWEDTSGSPWEFFTNYTSISGWIHAKVGTKYQYSLAIAQQRCWTVSGSPRFTNEAQGGNAEFLYGSYSTISFTGLGIGSVSLTVSGSLVISFTPGSIGSFTDYNSSLSAKGTCQRPIVAG